MQQIIAQTTLEISTVSKTLVVHGHVQNYDFPDIALVYMLSCCFFVIEILYFVRYDLKYSYVKDCTRGQTFCAMCHLYLARPKQTRSHGLALAEMHDIGHLQRNAFADSY